MTLRRRHVVVALLVVVALALPAGPAFADPAGPTHYRSTVTGVSAADGGPVPVEIDILGGDAFLVLRAAPGTTVEVPGYEGEPYLRIGPDGAVEVNERSPARWLNDARYGGADVEVPALADADAPPTWVPAASDGEYAWHDHRVHFMSPSLPPGIDPGVDEAQEVLTWEVPLRVDGRDVVVSGQLAWVPGPGPAPSVVALLVLLAAVHLGLLRRPRWVGPVIAAAAVGALAVGAAGNLGLPAGAEGDLALVVLPIGALVVVAVGEVLGRRHEPARSLLVPAAGLPLAVWGVLQFGALTRPIVPSLLPVVVVRGSVVVVSAVAAAALLVAGRSVLERTRLQPDDDLRTERSTG